MQWTLGKGKKAGPESQEEVRREAEVGGRTMRWEGVDIGSLELVITESITWMYL